MRSLKKVGIKTKEGLEVRNYQTFPSMEWGDDGGMQADIYFNGKYLAKVFQEGNGGCAIAYMQTKNETEWSDFKQACYNFLVRNNKNYGANSEFEWLRNKTAQTIDDDDLEAVVNDIVYEHDIRKDVMKYFKKQYGSVAVIERPLGICSYLSFRVNDATMDECISYVKKNNIKYDSIKLYHNTDLELSIF